MSEETSPPLGAILRRALVRGVVFGVLFALGCTGVFVYFGKMGVLPWVLAPLVAFLGGIAIAPASALEMLAARWKATWIRDVVVLALACVLGAVVVFLGTLQANFTEGLIQSRTIDGGRHALQNILDGYLYRPERFVPLTVAFGVPLGPLVVGRLRRFGFGQMLVVEVGGTAVLAFPWLAGFERSDLVPIVLFVAAVTLVLADRLTDLIEKRIAGWFER
jgi:hypothetical protein